MVWCLHRSLNLDITGLSGATWFSPRGLGIAWPIAPVIVHRCIRSLPVRPVLNHRSTGRCYCFLHPFVQLVAIAFSLWFGISAVDWTYLNGELDILEIVWTSSMKPKNSINVISLLVPLIMLSHNHQNHKQWPNVTMFLTLSHLQWYSNVLVG